MRRTFQLLSIGLAVLFLGVLAFGRLQDRLILFPSATAHPAPGVERLQIPYGASTLTLWRARSDQVRDEPVAFVLRFQGNMGGAERWAAAEARSLPCACELWALSYPGFDGSAGRASLTGVADSALAAYDALRARAGRRPILVFGTSLGTTAALHVAAQRPVAGLVLQNPPPLRQLIVGEHGWWNLWLLAYPVALQVPSELDSLANAARVHAPAVFLLSGQDEVVPYAYQRRVFNAYAGPKTAIERPEARHNDPIDPEVGSRLSGQIAIMVRAQPGSSIR